jgi:hydroxymethylpyrimidine pyrophosphatase-like HAD family hydrolase
MAEKPSKYPTRRTIYVDVDGTLHLRGIANRELIEWLRAKRGQGFDLVLWSARGGEYARRVAETLGCADLFVAILAKPGYIVDDEGWQWIKWTKRVGLRWGEPNES